MRLPQGDELRFGVDTDNLGSDAGADFAARGVTFTVTYSDGSTATMAYESDGAGGSVGTLVTDFTSDGVIIDGGAGDDILVGTDADDTLDGGAGIDEVNGQGGHDILIFDALDTVVDGGAGEDTLKIDGSVSNLGATVSNIEVVDMADSSGGDSLSLSLSDVLSVTDADDVLFVEGDVADSVTLQSADGWSQISDVSDPDYRDGYALYEAGGAKLYVDDEVDVNLVP